MILPDTCDDLLCSCLTPLELVRYSLVCRDARRAVLSYCQRAYKLKRTLARFMSGDEVDRFQLLQSRTGAVISGSTALQFLGRYDFIPTDLDIYVEHRYAKEIGRFLTVLGYHYEPRTSQPVLFSFALQRDERQATMWTVGGSEPYGSPAMCGAYNFVRPNNPDVRIQLITSRLSVMDIILDFHCTAVMNVITHRNAFSLYPYETFHAMRALVARRRPGRREEEAFRKYSERGWHICRGVPRSETDDPYEEFGQGTRRVGDEMSWTLPLSQQGRHGALAIDTLPGNSWLLHYQEYYTAQGGYRRVQFRARMLRHFLIDEHEDWRQMYTFATAAHHTAFMAELRRIQPNESEQTDADIVRAVERSYVRLVASDDEYGISPSISVQADAHNEERLFRRYASENNDWEEFVSDGSDGGSSD